MMLQPCCWALLLIGCAAVVDASAPRHRPITRREGALQPDTEKKVSAGSPATFRPKERGWSAASLMQLTEGTHEEAARKARGCPDAVWCGGQADAGNFTQECWDCNADYQEFFCEKKSLRTVNGVPDPEWWDVCAKEGSYRGAYCKKFAEMTTPRYESDCFFPGSEYKQLFCEKKKLKGSYVTDCARDNDVGPSYCESFAMKMTGYVECNAWPGYMMLFCETKQNATIWDEKCANHNELGANFCEDFALIGEIKPECVKYNSYMTLFCDIKANQNASVKSCADDTSTQGMYCQELALKQNGFEDCKIVANFLSTYCAEIPWTTTECQNLLSR